MSETGELVTVEQGWVSARWSSATELDAVRRRLEEELDRLRETRRAWMALETSASDRDPPADAEGMVQDAVLTVADAMALACARLLLRLLSPRTAIQGEDHEQYAEVDPVEVAWSTAVSLVAGGTSLHLFMVPVGFEGEWWRTEPVALCGATPGIGGVDTRLSTCADCLARREATSR